ncbi:FadR/GntR family transcriptional regulator [Streptomyces violens]|uniref:FadR/GntR family transcriptional regulator n=1 Tax=Streptomyces violens TaxID=66377 RepID=UPI0004BE8B35|nr:FadR/GntR family transcriptional regulator [Streptomyces violens]
MTSYAGRGVHGQVVERLGYRIVSGEVPEGATLDPREMAAELDISLTVIRETLKVLAGKGLVAARQKRGTFVRPRGEWNMLDADVIRWRVAGGKGEALLRDFAELRAIIEPAAVRHAAERRTDADLAALERALTAMGEAGDDTGAAAAADAAFHRALLTASGNEMLTRLDQLMEPVLRARDGIVHAPHGVADDPVPSHRAVLEAIRERDADRASAAMVYLLAKSVADFDRAVRSASRPGE